MARKKPTTANLSVVLVVVIQAVTLLLLAVPKKRILADLDDDSREASDNGSRVASGVGDRKFDATSKGIEMSDM